MSYYRPSFTQSTGSMPRGRGSFSSSRGSSSYRGGSSRGSSSWSSSGSRGYHGTNSRGSSATYRSSGGGYSGSFDTRSAPSKYGGERITSFRGSGGGGEEYRKPSYRPEASYSRESRLSPERKRMRTESRHESYADSSMPSRYSDASSSFSRSKQQQLTSTPFHRAGGEFRKPLAPPPPPNISNYSAASSGRLGYRGGGGRPAGSRYIVSSSRDGSVRSSGLRPPPRRLMDYSATVAWRGSSRGGSSMRAQDYARRMRLRHPTNRSTIIRSSRPIHSSRIKRNDSDDELWGVVRDDDDDDDEEEDNDEGVEEKDTAPTIKAGKDSAKDSAADSESEAKVAKKSDDTDDKGDDEEDEKGDDDEEEKDEAKPKVADAEETTEVVKKKSPTKKVSSSKERERSHSPDPEIHRRKQYIKLVCPYCSTRCITFARYSNHLRSARHSAAMHHVALKQKTALSRMRVTQRAEQKAIERATDEADLTPHTNFCPLCKLNYRQAKAVHRASKAHRDMKRFLMPVCRTCQLTCKSPMLYETHCCSLEHIKRKAYSSQNGDKSDKSEHSGDDLQNYMTIDSVGDMDDIDMDLPPPPPPNVSDSPTKDTSSGADATEAGEPPKPSKARSDKDRSVSSVKREREPQINVGVENIRQIEVHYCDLCRMYLPRVEDSYDDLDRILAKHCKQRTHMQRYIRYKEDKDLAKRAERLQRREMAEKEKEKDSKKVASSSSKDESPSSSKPSSAQTKSQTATEPDESSSAAANDQESAPANSLDDTQDVTMKDTLKREDEDEEEQEKRPDDEEEDQDDVKEILEADEAEAGEDKLWEDVDKDLGDILAGEKQEDEEDEEDEEDDGRVVNGERYDRFKYSEKNAKTGNVGKVAPAKKGAKKAEADSGAGEKNQVEGETTK